MPVLAVLADGCRALSRRRLWPFLRLRADQDRIRDRSIRDGGEASARLARPPPCRQRISRRQGLYDRGHRGVALVWQPREGLAVWSGRTRQRFSPAGYARRARRPADRVSASAKWRLPSPAPLLSSKPRINRTDSIPE